MKTITTDQWERFLQITKAQAWIFINGERIDAFSLLQNSIKIYVWSNATEYMYNTTGDIYINGHKRVSHERVISKFTKYQTKPRWKK